MLNGFQSGGVESFIFNLLSATKHDDIKYDFLLRTHNNDVNKIRVLKKINCHIYYTASFPNKILKNYFETKKFFKEKSNYYDVIHVHANSLMYILPIFLAKKYSSRSKLVLHSHNTKPVKEWMTKIHFFNKNLLKNKVITNLACGEEAGKWMFSSSYTVIPNSIETEKFRINIGQKKKLREEMGIFDEKIILCLGRLARQKNLSFIIPTIAKLAKNNPRIRLYLVGDGNERNMLEEMIDYYKIEKIVKFFGSRSDTDNFYKISDLFLMPSLYEGLSIAALEAQASGVDVIVSDRIPKECIVCKNVYSLPLDEKVWENKIGELCQKELHVADNNWQMVEQAGYSLENLREKILLAYSS